MALPHFHTIGAYGSAENEFFEKLVQNNIDTLIDIRRRRAVRGSEYAFANSNRLQDKLAKLAIRYIHEPGLAPTEEMITAQGAADKMNKVARRQRTELSPSFKKSYTNEVLSVFNLEQFAETLGKTKAKRVAFFCVEKSPEACHRFLVCERLRELIPQIRITHL